MNWKTKTNLTVATHSAPHHMDELVALAMLKHWAKQRSINVEVSFLTRQQLRDEDLSRFDLLLDVGEVYDPESGRFDHHQVDPAVKGRATCGLLLDALKEKSLDCSRAAAASSAPAADASDLAADVNELATDASDHAEDRARPSDAGHEFTNSPLITSIIREMEQIDNGIIRPVGMSAYYSLRAVIRATSGHMPSTENSLQALAVVEKVFAYWIAQSGVAARIENLPESVTRTRKGIFFDDDSCVGLPAKQRLHQKGFNYLGFPDTPGRYIVVVTIDDEGNDATDLGPLQPFADFVHANGFMAVFPGKQSAVRAMTGFEKRSQP